MARETQRQREREKEGGKQPSRANSRGRGWTEGVTRAREHEGAEEGHRRANTLPPPVLAPAQLGKRPHRPVRFWFDAVRFGS